MFNNKHIAIIVSCSKRKRQEACSQMLFHTMPTMKADLLATEWLKRAGKVSQYYEAKNLYSGAGLKYASDAIAFIEDQGGTSSLYLFSAGFGLIRTQDRIPAYMATFSSDINQIYKKVENSGSTADAHKAWWQSIMLKRKEDVSLIFSELNSSDYVFFAASANYLKAAEKSIDDLISHLGQERLFIISVAGKEAGLSSAIQSCLLPIDTSVERILPGPRNSINERSLLWILGEIIPEDEWNRYQINELLLEEMVKSQKLQASFPKNILNKMEDFEIKEWIMLHLQQQPGISKNRLLRLFRSDSRSCKQSRFYQLVTTVKEERALI
ncbi:hypothetical protein ACFLUJ_02110 [Chloroflexota bacterium]